MKGILVKWAVACHCVSPGRHMIPDADGFKCGHWYRCWNIKENHSASGCFMNVMSIFSLSIGHWDYQHRHSDRTHCGHPCQNGLHRDEWSSHRRLGLCPVQVLKWRHCKGTVNLISTISLSWRGHQFRGCNPFTLPLILKSGSAPHSTTSGKHKNFIFGCSICTLDLILALCLR